MLDVSQADLNTIMDQTDALATATDTQSLETTAEYYRQAVSVFEAEWTRRLLLYLPGLTEMGAAEEEFRRVVRSSQECGDAMEKLNDWQLGEPLLQNDAAFQKRDIEVRHTGNTLLTWQNWQLILLNDVQPLPETLRQLSSGIERSLLAVAERQVLALRRTVMELERLQSQLSCLNESDIPDWLNQGVQKLTPVLADGTPPGTAFSSRSLTGLAVAEQIFLRNSGYHIRTCALCGRRFAAFTARQRFCSRIAPDADGTCAHIGPSRLYRKTVDADPVLQIYGTNYKTYHAWIQATKRKIQADEDHDGAMIDSHMVLKELIQNFNNWCGLAGDVRKEYLQGQINAEAAFTKIKLPKVAERSPLYQAWRADQRSRRGL